MRGPSRALENMAIKWLCGQGRLYGPWPIAQCCPHFDETQHDAKARLEGRPHLKWGGLCERDLLQMARESLYWRHVAILCGFSMAKINAPWAYTKTLALPDGTLLENWPDEGRKGIVAPELWEIHVKYDAKDGQVRLRQWRVL